MSLHLGDTVPNFTAETTFGEIDFFEYLGNSWGILLSHPADYTPVCTTEIGRTAELSEEFRKRNVKPLVVSVDPIKDHHGWVQDINEIKNTNVDFPLIADPDRKVSLLYDMIHPNASATATVRSVFIIGPDKTLKLTLTYPPAIGRNFEEIIRVIDALQLSAIHNVSTPADWRNGDDVIIPNTVTTQQATERYNSQVKVVKPYLRFVSQPGKHRWRHSIIKS